MSEVLTSSFEALTETESIHIAVHFMSKQDYASALSHLKNATSQHPLSVQLQFLLGAVYADLDMQEESIESLKKAVACQPDFNPAQMLLGLFLFLSGQTDDAFIAWGFVENLPKEHAFHSFILGFKLLSEERFSEAISTLKEGVTQPGTFSEINHEIERLCRRVNDDLADSADVDVAHRLLSRYGGQ